MRLVLRYAKRLANGTWEYRRRIPKSVKELLQRGEFKRVLGTSEKEALKNYPRVNGTFEELIARSAREIAIQARLAGPETEAEAARLARKRLRELQQDVVFLGGRQFPATDPDAADLYVDSILASYPEDPETGNPTAIPRSEAMALHALVNGTKVAEASPTVEDAKRLYIREKLNGGLKGDEKKTADRVIRLVGVVHEVLGSPLRLSDIGREGAKEVRDALADSMKSNGKSVAPATVKRNLNTLKAMINHAITELELQGKVSNPFNKLPVRGLNEEETEADKRDPFPMPMLIELRERILSSCNSELCLVWRLLEGTGCRGAEITGLRASDVVIEGETPHIVVTWHEDRRVKSKASRRHVPLTGDARDAAKEALSLSREGFMLFPRYGREGGADAASQAPMKHVRRLTENERLVVYSLRHNMKDWLRLAEVGALDQNLILGHSLGGVGDRVYGGTPAKLRITSAAMRKAYGVRLEEEKRAKAGLLGKGA